MKKNKNFNLNGFSDPSKKEVVLSKDKTFDTTGFIKRRIFEFGGTVPIIVPDTPQNLTVIEAGDTQVELNWDDLATDFDSYTLYVQNNSTNSIEQTITELEVSNNIITELTNDIEYEFWVVSVLDGVESEESNHVTATPQAVTSAALTLNGTDQYISLGTMGDFGSQWTSPFTIEFWYQASDQTRNFVMGISQLRTNDTAFGMSLSIQLNLGDVAGRFFLQLRDGVADDYRREATSVGELYDGLVHHMAVVVTPSSSDSKLYIDGVEVSLSTTDGGTPEVMHDFDIPFRVGANASETSPGVVGDPTVFFDGKLDDIRFWTEERTITQINNNKDAYLASGDWATDYPNLHRYYPCNDGSGDQLSELVAEDHATLVGNVADNIWTASLISE